MIKSILLASILLSSFSGLAADETKKVPNQSSFLLKQAPLGLLSLPSEGIYRAKRSLGVDAWTKMRKKAEVKGLLLLSQVGRVPKKNTTFPFENYDEDFADVVNREFGVCSGFSTLQRNFNILMSFDPNIRENKKNYSLYFKLIDQAVGLNPVVIPGYENLGEFFSNPIFQKYVKKSIVKSWAKNNASWQGIEQFIKHKKQLPKSKWAKFHKELSSRINLGYNPIIYASFPPTEDIKNNIHVMQAMDVSELKADGTFDVTIWDDGVMHEYYGNYSPEKLVKVISFRSNGEILWLESPEYLNLPLEDKNNQKVQKLIAQERIDQTMWIDLLPNDDLVMSKLVKKKLKWCKSSLNQQYCF